MVCGPSVITVMRVLTSKKKKSWNPIKCVFKGVSMCDCFARAHKETHRHTYFKTNDIQYRLKLTPFRHLIITASLTKKG